MKRDRFFQTLRTDTADAPCTPQDILTSSCWPALQHAPVTLTVQIPLRCMKPAEIASLSAGAIIASSWSASEEIAVLAGGTPLSWCEFDGTAEAMTVRLTRLA